MLLNVVTTDRLLEVQSDMPNWLAAVLTFSAGIIGALIPIFYNIHKEKILKRVILSVSLLNNKVDNIDDRLNYETYRWFVDLNKVGTLSEQCCIYLVLQSSGKYNAYNCQIKIQKPIITGNPKNVPFAIGTLTSQRKVIIPLLINEGVTEIQISLEFETECHELMKYKLTSKLNDTTQILTNRDDSLWVRRFRVKLPRKVIIDDKYKEVMQLNRNLTESYSSYEVRKALGKGGTLNYKKISEEGENIDGTNNYIKFREYGI